jgi:hypothetical protein
MPKNTVRSLAHPYPVEVVTRFHCSRPERPTT